MVVVGAAGGRISATILECEESQMIRKDEERRDSRIGNPSQELSLARDFLPERAGVEIFPKGLQRVWFEVCGRFALGSAIARQKFIPFHQTYGGLTTNSRGRDE